MNGFRRNLRALLVCMVFALTARNAIAQDVDADRERDQQLQAKAEERARQEQQEQQWIKQSRDQFVDADRDSARRALDSFARPASRVEREFLLAVPQFRRAVTTYREAISLTGSLKESVKGLDRFVDLFKEYFKATHVDLPTVDKAEFNSFSKKELIWETLTTAERVDGDLRLAIRQMQEAKTTNTVSIETVVFMRDLHGDVLRLEKLLSKVK